MVIKGLFSDWSRSKSSCQSIIKNLSIKCLYIIVAKFCSTSWTSHLQMEYLIAYPRIPFNTSFIWDIKCTWFDEPLFPLAFVNGSLEAHFEVNLRLISTIYVACETNSKINERSQLRLQFNLLWWYIKSRHGSKTYYQGALTVRWCVIIDVRLASFYFILCLWHHLHTWYLRVFTASSPFKC